MLHTLGMAVAALALLLFNVGLWLEVGWGPFWQTAFCCITVMIGLAHGLLLQLPRLSAAQRCVQRATGWAIALSVALICALVISPDRVAEAVGYPRSPPSPSCC